MRIKLNRTQFWGIFVVLLNIPLIAADNFQTCLDGKHHKSQPSTEKKLEQCKAWRNLSCCTSDVAEQVSIDGSKLYNFNYSHCGNMSKSCLSWFIKNHCFYECSPNLGPWLIKVNSTYRNEKFQNLPLCKRDCDDWWNACKLERTCVRDWSKGFKWSKAGNQCPSGTTCQYFKDLFPNATYFCENIYGPHDYRVTETELCLTFNFNGTNPNTKIASSYYTALKKKLDHDSQLIPPYIPPESTSPLQVSGTMISVVLASLVLAIICVVGLIYAVKTLRRRQFSHQTVPVQVKDMFKKQRSSEIAESEMSFMRYDEEEDESPELNGALKMEL